MESWERRLDRMVLGAVLEAENMRPCYGLPTHLYYLPAKNGRWGQLTARQYCPTGFTLVDAVSLDVSDHVVLVAHVRALVRRLPILGA